ncbi:hypothetical protein KGF57_000780 [Candida theae]|uniref:Uncharacterized protein n=1 Tax=Candida theae TaxID=1198502 RepID=A0AAD5BIE1_9ASCO|nr:uncharacterized protein KGF57_000780 [Candida theae]KAI5965514.1 hypothetical protein KGF57_000780 [Candida theae]
MPLDLFEENGDAEHYNFTELRLEIIGNKDLKFKLLNDVAFMNQLVSSFVRGIIKFTGSEIDSSYPLDSIEEVVVIFHILCSFASEIDQLTNESVPESVGIMQSALEPIAQLLNYVVEKVLPSLMSTSSDKYTFQIEALMGYCLDILILLSNLRQPQINPTRIWRYVTALLAGVDSNGYSPLKLHTNTYIKSLRLIPLVLATPVPLSNHALLSLSVTLLNRLSSVCQSIVQKHASELYHSQESLYRLAFEDRQLPSVDLNDSLVSSVVSTELLLEMINASSHLLHFSKTHQDPFLLAIRQEAPPGIFISTPLSKPLIPVTEIHVTLLLLLKVTSKEFNVAALNLLVLILEVLGFSEVLSEDLIFRSYDKLFAKIVQLLNGGGDCNGNYGADSGQNTKTSDYKQMNSLFESKPLRHLPSSSTSAVKILANLCTQFPSLNNRICDTNIDYQLVCKVMHCFDRTSLFKDFEELKLKSKFGTVLVDFTSIPVGDLYSTELVDLFLLLSVYTSESEEYRNRLVLFYQSTGSNIPKVIFEIVENYHFLLNQIRLLQKILRFTIRSENAQNETIKHQLSWLGKNMGVISEFTNSPLFTHCFYFIRSQSRSVATLRTFFVEANSFKSFITRDSKATSQAGQNGVNLLGTNSSNSTIGPRMEGGDTNSAIASEPSSSSSAGGFVTNILEIIRLFETLDLAWDFILNANTNKSVRAAAFKKTYMTNKALCVSLLANFILDFSSFRYKIIGYENFLSSLSIIYQNSASDLENVSDITNDEIFERNVMQLKILQVMKNFMYNEASENKQEVLNFFPLSLILQNANFGLVAVDNLSSLPNEILKIKIQQKVVAFEILRNFTAGSPSFSRILRDSYINEYLCKEEPEFQKLLPQDWTEFVIRNLTEASVFIPQAEANFDFYNDETLLNLISNEDYVKMVRSINFTEDHTYTVIDKLKQELFPSDSLLGIWMRLLSFKLPEMSKGNSDHNMMLLSKNLNMIKISIAWILVNLTWKSSVFGHDIQNYIDYEVYQTFDTSRIKREIAIQDQKKESLDGESSEDRELSGSELSVYDRAKYLDEFGFTKVIYDVLTDYSRKASRISQSTLDADSSIEPEVFEKLRSALHQINYLCRGVRSGRFVPDLRNNHTGGSNDLRLHRNQDNSVDVIDDGGELADEEIRYERSRRRDAIDSEDDENNEDEEMQEGDSSGSNAEMQVAQATNNDSDDSNEDMPHEYWVM